VKEKYALFLFAFLCYIDVEVCIFSRYKLIKLLMGHKLKTSFVSFGFIDIQIEMKKRNVHLFKSANTQVTEAFGRLILDAADVAQRRLQPG
jgi:hypothetical protein